MKLLTSLRDTYCPPLGARLASGGLLRPTANHQSGFMFVAIILIVLVIFSISIVSGADDFAFSPDPTGKPSPTTSPTATPSAGTVPTATPDPSAGWTVSYISEGCTQEIIPYQKGKLTSTGLSNGYITIEVINGSSSQRILSTQFNPPQTIYDMKLSNKDNFHNLTWRINLYEGGTGSGNNFTGGTLKASYNGSPTGC